MSGSYRVGIIGCGGMGGSHARHWTQKPQTDVVAVADVSERNARKLADEFDAKPYTDHAEMLEEEACDIVSITTWQNVRAEITVKAAEAGAKGILGEKPMASSLREADLMLASCEQHGVKLAIGHQRRFTPQNVEARRLVMDGAIGAPTAMLRRDAHGLLNRGTHELDEMMYVLGDPAPIWVIGQVTRKTDRWERRVRCEDRCAAIIAFEGGIRGTYESDLPDPGLQGDVVYGTEGILKRGPEGGLLLLNRHAGDWQSITPPPVEIDQYDEFIAWLDGGVEGHRNDGETARLTMELMMAIYESARIRDVVELPLQTGDNPLDLMVEEGALPVEIHGRYDIRAPFPEQTN